MVAVKHASNTAEHKPTGYTSWLDFWKKKSGKGSPGECFQCGKKTDDLDGAHVKKVNGSDSSKYIVPVCSECNGKGEGSFSVNGDDLVKASLLSDWRRVLR